ncbi:hypothetical protein HKD37_03G007106 [Glycine soja]
MEVEEWKVVIFVAKVEAHNVAPCRACRPWILFITRVLCFLKITGGIGSSSSVAMGCSKQMLNSPLGWSEI